MIILTRPAIAALENVLQREGKIAGGVRISATNGGCSGPNYEMAIESDPGPDDTVIEIRGVRLFVPAENMPMLVGVTVDYAPGGDGAGFIFENPEAAPGNSTAPSGCGCGKACSSAPTQ
jgi:iron-sulfur cluster assembly protein